MSDNWLCYNPQNITSFNSLAPPSYAPSICKKLGKFPCYAKNGLFYCTTNIGDCFSPINGCPVDKPVLCNNGMCVNNPIICGGSTYTPQTSVALTITNKDQCPPATPFRCSYLDNSACATLPFSSYYALRGQTCTQGAQVLEGTYFVNSCVNGATPYSCGDGSCVSEPSQCNSCPFFCPKLAQCMSSQSDCDKYTANPLLYEFDHICPTGSPITCILNGKCVSDAAMCPYLDQIRPETGLLFDGSCPSETPIRCISGKCASKYSQCFSPSHYETAAFQSPVAWGPDLLSSSTTIAPCQVYCSDGSCRDRQENCPTIKACNNPLKPYRCMSGYCARDKTACIFLFGPSENETAGAVSTACQVEAGSSLQLYRCEDGSCRPAITANSTSLPQCLSFQGCSLLKPYQCPTGECVQQYTDCLQYSHCNKKYMCADSSCVESPYDCTQSDASAEVVQMKFDLDILTGGVINFAYKNSQPVARLNLSKNCMTVAEQSITTRKGIQPITFYPVPKNVTDAVLNTVPKGMIHYLKKKVQIDSDGNISPDSTLLGPAFFVTNLNQPTQELISGSTVEFKLDSWKASLNKDTDMCLAYVTGGTWTCHSRNYTTTSDGFVSFPLPKLGVTYALILHPDPTEVCKVRCWASMHPAQLFWFVYVPAGLLLLAVVVVLVLVFCRKNGGNEDTSSTSETEEPEKSPVKPKPQLKKQAAPAKKVEEKQPLQQHLSNQILEVEENESVAGRLEKYNLDDSEDDQFEYTDRKPKSKLTESRTSRASRNESPPVKQPPRVKSTQYSEATGLSKRKSGIERSFVAPEADRPLSSAWNKSSKIADFQYEQTRQNSTSSRNPQSLTQTKPKSSSFVPTSPKTKAYDQPEVDLDQQWYNLANEYLHPEPSYSYMDGGTSPSRYEGQDVENKRDIYDRQGYYEETLTTKSKSKKKKSGRMQAQYQ